MELSNRASSTTTWTNSYSDSIGELRDLGGLLFYRLLQQAVITKPVPYGEIVEKSIGSINPLFTEFQQYPEPSPAGV